VRYIGRPDWVKRTIQELRTGMYARVLEPGSLQVFQVILEARLNPGLTIRDLNACFYHAYNADLAARFIAAEGLMDWWKQRLRDTGNELKDSTTAR
jgi:MOSC domain-containing protein YiiM